MSRPPDSLRRFTPLDHGPPLPPLDTYSDIIPQDVSPAPVPPPHQICSSGRPLVPFDPHPFPSPPLSSRLSRLPGHERRASYVSGYSSHYSQSSSRSNSGSSLLILSGGSRPAAPPAAEYTLRRPPDLPPQDFLAQHPHLVFRRTAALHRQGQGPDYYRDPSSSSPPSPSPPERHLPRPGFATGSPRKHRRAAVQRLRRPGLPSVVEVASSQERLARDETATTTTTSTTTSNTARMSQNSYGRRDLPEPPPPPQQQHHHHHHHSFRDADPAGVASPNRGWYQSGPGIGPYGDARRAPDSHYVATTASPARQQARLGYDSRLPRRVPAALGTATTVAAAAPPPPPTAQIPDVRRPPPRESFSQPRPQGRLQPSEASMSGIHPALRQGRPLLASDHHPGPAVAASAALRAGGGEDDDGLSIAGPAFMRPPPPPQGVETYGYNDDDGGGGGGQSCHRTISSATSTAVQEQEPAKRLRVRGPRDPSFKLRTKRSTLQDAPPPPPPPPQQTDAPTRLGSISTVSSAGATWHGSSATESSAKSVLERSDSDKSSYHSFPEVILAEQDEDSNSGGGGTPSNDQTPRATTTTTTTSSAQDQTPTATALRRRPSSIPVPRRPSDKEGTPTPQPLTVPSSKTPAPVSASAAASTASTTSSSPPPAPAADKQQHQQQQQQKQPPSDPEEEPNWTLKTTSSSTTSSSQRSDAASEPTWRPSRLHDTVSRTRAHYDQYVIRMYPTSSDSLAASGGMPQRDGGGGGGGGANTTEATRTASSASASASSSSSSPPPPPIPARAPNRPSGYVGRTSSPVAVGGGDEDTASSAAAASSCATTAVDLTAHEQVELHNLGAAAAAADWTRQSRSSCSGGVGDKAEKQAAEPDSEPDSSSCFGGLRRLWRKK